MPGLHNGARIIEVETDTDLTMKCPCRPAAVFVPTRSRYLSDHYRCSKSTVLSRFDETLYKVSRTL
jgi:hypothetical protein